MTKEEIFKEFISDDFFSESGIVAKEKIGQMRFSEQSGNKLVETIKLAIDSMKNGESDTVTARKLNLFLNK